jgi:IS1 family transposase
MKNQVSRAEQFKEELAKLCAKFNCEIEAADHWIGYAECGQDVRMTVTFRSDYSVEPHVHTEDVDLGRYFP